MDKDNLPDLAHASEWLKAARAVLYETRDWLRGDPAHRSLREDAPGYADKLDSHAATLGDIIARANIVSRDRVELPTVEQANALRRARPGANVASIRHRPFDLPADYLLVEYEDGFTCGIAPNGDVSS